MIYPDKAVRTAVFKILSDAGIIAFDSTAPDDAQTPYVLLLNQDSIDFNTKQRFGFVHSLTLSAVHVSQTPTGKEVAEDLLNQAITLLTPARPMDPVKIDLSPAPFKCWKISAGQTKDVVFTGDTETVYQKIVTLTLNIDAL